MKEWWGFLSRIWVPTKVGFESYKYKYASGGEEKAPFIGLLLQKPPFSIYVYSPTEKCKPLLKEFGKYKMAKSRI